MIPKDIYIAHKTKEQVINYCQPLWKKLNPEYEVHSYGNDECINFLRINYGKLHVDIFNHIKDGPIKCDFWRVCILYKYGGVYADADIQPLVPIHEIVEAGVQFMTAADYTYKKVNPHLIISAPENPILKDCINTYIDFYTKNKLYIYWEWSITNIMSIALTKYTGISEYREGIYKDVQLISEIFPRGGSLYDIYCTYKNRRLLNNRLSNYNAYTHTFGRSKPVQKIGILHRIFR
jgi:hypothetical protein